MAADAPKKKASGRRPLTAAVDSSRSHIQRTNGTTSDKIMILDFIQDHPKMSQTAVAAHFRKKGFPTITQSTISRIIRDAKKIRKDGENTGNLTYKRRRLVEHPEIEAALAMWVLQAQTKGIRITADILREKARRFAKIQGIDPKDFLSLSNGWVDSFKQRHGLKHYRFHGEAGSTAETDVEVARKRLRKITDGYALRDILNMDETGLNDRMPPDRGLATAQFAGKKADKHRLTYALTTNADGSDTFPPLVIGHAKRPRAFQKKSGKDLGFDYHWNKKAWMTGAIFQAYLANLNARMRKENRQVLLLIDNAPSHIYDPETLTNVKVEHLEPNMTSRIQPMDAGIIKTFKAHYTRFFCKRAIDRDEAGEDELYKINQLEAMRMADEAWGCVAQRTVANCWRHAGIVSPRDASGAVIPDNTTDNTASRSKKPQSVPGVEAAVKELDAAIKELGKKSIAPSKRMTAEEMLESGSLETEGFLDDKEIMDQVMKDRRVAEAEADGVEIEDSDDDAEEILEPVITAAEGARYLRALARLFDTQVRPEFREASQLIPRLLRGLNLTANEAKEQKMVTDYFYEWPQSP